MIAMYHKYTRESTRLTTLVFTRLPWPWPVEDHVHSPPLPSPSFERRIDEKTATP
jgi:hypothetical protein